MHDGADAVAAEAVWKAVPGGLQMMMDPSSSSSRVLPFWFSREIGT